jgi:PPOX class probable F420-dependent enzyme
MEVVTVNQAQAEFIKRHRQAVLATIRKDGRPQLSNVLSLYMDGKLKISTTETRAKYHNLVRDPRATLLLQGDSFFQYVVIDGTAEITRLPEALPLLREYYEAASGPHPDWNEYDEAMRQERRVIVSITIEKVTAFGI